MHWVNLNLKTFQSYIVVEDIDRLWKNLHETLNSAIRLYYTNIDSSGQHVGLPLAEKVLIIIILSLMKLIYIL